MIWAILGIFHSIFRAMSAEANRLYRADIWHTSFLNNVVALVLLLFCLPMMVWPESADFYISALLVAVIIGVGQIIMLNLAIQKKGRISSISIPIEALAAFVIWVLVAPHMSDYYMRQPSLTAVVVFGMVMSGFALFAIRKTDLSGQTLMVAMPLGMTYAIAGVATKMAVPFDDLIGASLSFIFVNYIVMTTVVGLFLLVKKRATKEIFSLPVLRTGVMTGIFSALAYTSFIMAVVYSPNPAYISIMAALVPVWLMFYHEMRYIDEQSNPVSGFFIVVCVLAMIAAASQM